MFPLKFLLPIFVCLSTAGAAQQRWVNGYLRDSLTHYPIIGASLTNENSRKTVRSDLNGFFRLEAAPNDLIIAVAPSYHHDTLRYSALFSDTITVFLSPSGVLLTGVTVQTRYTKYQLDSLERRREFEENTGTRLNTVSSANNLGFGVGINLDRLFKKRYRDKKTAEHRFEKREKEAYVDFRFSPHTVASYTGLKGEELRTFLYRYRPSYQWLRQHPSPEDLLWYINEKLKEFKAQKKGV